MLQLFGDVPSVIASEQLRPQFCSLPYAAVLKWLRMDDLAVHSENCVLLLMTAWVEAQAKAGDVCSTVQLDQLARQVRVNHVGPAYLHSILPSLSWFSQSKQLLPLLLASKAMPAFKPASRNAAFPPAWTAVSRQRCQDPCSVTLGYSLEAGQLQEVYAGNPVDFPASYVNGFMMQVKAVPESGASGSKLGLLVATSSKDVPSNLPWTKNDVLMGDVSATVGAGASQIRGPWVAFAWAGGVPQGLPAATSSSAATVRGLLAPYLVGGRLPLCIHLRKLDQVGAQLRFLPQLEHLPSLC